MSPERWREIEAVFQSAMDLSPAERAAFLDTHCSNDAELRSEVEKLLKNAGLADTFIESPVWADSRFLDASAKHAISQIARSGYVPPYFIGMSLLAVGEIDRAFEHFNGKGLALRADRG